MTLEQLKQSCHAHIGKPFKDSYGMTLGTITRTRIRGRRLLVFVDLSRHGRRQIDSSGGITGIEAIAAEADE